MIWPYPKEDTQLTARVKEERQLNSSLLLFTPVLTVVSPSFPIKSVLTVALIKAGR